MRLDVLVNFYLEFWLGVTSKFSLDFFVSHDYKITKISKELTGSLHNLLWYQYE